MKIFAKWTGPAAGVFRRRSRNASLRGDIQDLALPRPPAGRKPPGLAPPANQPRSTTEVQHAPDSQEPTTNPSKKKNGAHDEVPNSEEPLVNSFQPACLKTKNQKTCSSQLKQLKLVPPNIFSTDPSFNKLNIILVQISVLIEPFNPFIFLISECACI